nr:LA2681 family HEPN domain-containing protein [Neglectibacter sp. X4]
MIVSINAKPVFHGMFNQIKQEYVYARYECYCSLQTLEQPHFADKETHLINFADYPQYGIRIEQMKSAFKTLYGLFDKIAFFLNSYFDLGIHERDINFSHIWLRAKQVWARK